MSRSRQQAIGIDYRSKLLNPWGFASPGFFISGSVQSLRSKIVVEIAHTLEETIAACSQFDPHLLVLDIGLPDGDGFNVVDWLRQHENLAHLPLVVYSGRDLSPAERRYLTLGPTHFLAKARVQPQQLEALVLTMLRSLRQTQEAIAPQPAVPNS